MGEKVATDRELERQIWLRVMLICAVAFPAVAAINAMTLTTDARRLGMESYAGEPWLLELTSVAATFLLVPIVALLERRFPLASGVPFRHGMVLAAASIPFSLMHVAIMVGLRILLVPLFSGGGYEFFDDPLTDLLYEYRKDLFVYVVVIGLLTLSRQIELTRQEAAAARAEARNTGRLTLRSGGRTIHLWAREFDWAQAAGNYVAIKVAGRSYLPRITLGELERQLLSAQVDIVRVHRSRFVNRDRVCEVRPTRSGDVDIHLFDGTIIQGSRRYRQHVDPTMLGKGESAT